MEITSPDNRSNVEKHIRYLEDQAYRAILMNGKPMRSGEILDTINNSKYSAKLLKHVLSSSPRFAQIDRRWDLEARYEDKQRTVERVLNEIISMYGCPMSVEQIAQEISSVYERSPEYYYQMLERILANENKYFKTTDNNYGHANWLLMQTSDLDEDIIFDNDINLEVVEKIKSKIDDINLESNDYLKIFQAIRKKIKHPVDSKAVSFILFKALGDEFSSIEMFNSLYESDEFVWMSDNSWASKSNIKEYDKLLEKMADSLVDEIDESQVTIPTKNEEVEGDTAPTLSLNVSERDLDEVAQIVESKGAARLPSILENIFEISARDQIYQIAADGLSDSMKADSRFTWLGTDRWTMTVSIPNFIYDVPKGFEIQEFDFETPEGEKIDIELEDEGLEDNLPAELDNPLILDLNDSDVANEFKDEEQSARMVFTALHKQTGVYPLCRIPSNFFPAGSNIMQFTFISDSSKHDIWINRNTGLIYGMDDIFPDEMHESGAVFEIEKTEKPDEFKIAYNNEADPDLAITQSRIDDLLALKEKAESENLSTFDILCIIMRFHRKGITFVSLFTELNIVRKTTRRMAASILSSYYAFYQRPKSNLWQFDEKKEDQGFKKAKRKYIKR